MQLSVFASNYRATFTTFNNEIINNFIVKNPAFREFASQKNVTVIKLRSKNFDLGLRRTLLGYRTVGNAVTNSAIPITPLLDEKLISKLAREYKKFDDDMGASMPALSGNLQSGETITENDQKVPETPLTSGVTMAGNNSTPVMPPIGNITINNHMLGSGDSNFR